MYLTKKEHCIFQKTEIILFNFNLFNSVKLVWYKTINMWRLEKIESITSVILFGKSK